MAVVALTLLVAPMVLVIPGVIVFALLGLAFLLMAKERGPGPHDTAIAYEQAWDRLDFSTLFDLSGAEMRDGLPRTGFVAAKRAAYAERAAARRLASQVVVEEIVRLDDTASARTRVVTSDGALHNLVRMERREGRWLVVGYGLVPEA